MLVLLSQVRGALLLTAESEWAWLEVKEHQWKEEAACGELAEEELLGRDKRHCPRTVARRAREERRRAREERSPLKLHDESTTRGFSSRSKNKLFWICATVEGR